MTKKKKMKFAVTVQRTEYKEHRFIVEAENESEAKEIALDESSPDHNWLDDGIDGVEEVVDYVEWVGEDEG